MHQIQRLQVRKLSAKKGNKRFNTVNITSLGYKNYEDNLSDDNDVNYQAREEDESSDDSEEELMDNPKKRREGNTSFHVCIITLSRRASKYQIKIRVCQFSSVTIIKLTKIFYY